MDIQLSFQFEPFNEQPYRALLFVNGWQYGKVSSKISCNGVDDIDDRDCALSVWRTSGRRRGFQCLRAYSSTTAKSECCGVSYYHVTCLAQHRFSVLSPWRCGLWRIQRPRLCCSSPLTVSLMEEWVLSRRSRQPMPKFAGERTNSAVQLMSFFIRP